MNKNVGLKLKNKKICLKNYYKVIILGEQLRGKIYIKFVKQNQNAKLNKY